MEWMMKPISTTHDSAMRISTSLRESWNAPEFQLERVKAEKARRSLKEFVVQAWPVLEPSTEFIDGIHIDAICTNLQAVTEGRIGHIIINVPPGHAKSLLTESTKPRSQATKRVWEATVMPGSSSSGRRPQEAASSDLGGGGTGNRSLWTCRRCMCACRTARS